MAKTTEEENKSIIPVENAEKKIQEKIQEKVVIHKPKPFELDLSKYRKINDDTLALLNEAFLCGASIEEACLNANIHPATYYRFKKDKPDVCETLEGGKNNLTLLAKKRLRTTIETDAKSGQLALATLERLDKDSFSTRQEIKKEEHTTQRIEVVVVSNDEVKRRRLETEEAIDVPTIAPQ